MKIKNNGEIAEINMTPFVDIVLILLIIFMATASFISEKSLKLELPKAKNAQNLEKNEKNIIVNIDSFGEIFINNKNIKQDLFLDSLDEFDIHSFVVIRCDAKAFYGIVIKVIDNFKLKGFNNFALEVKEDV